MRKSKVMVFLLSFVPGVGHYYLGMMQRGLQFNLVFFGTLFVLDASDLDILAFAIPVIWFYSLFDALIMANKMERGIDVPDAPAVSWNRLPVKASIVGWVLVFLGVYSFLVVNEFFTLPIPAEDINKMLAAAALIGFGVYLLFHPGLGRNGQNGSAEKEDGIL